MAKTKISEFSSTAADNTDITNINIAEGCSPANVNNAIRSLMSVLKNQQDGSSGDPFTVAGTFNATGGFQLDGTAGASGQVLLSAGGSNTPTWSTLGTMAAQNSTTVAITGGTITGITDLTVADGGTGASSITANSVILGNGTSALSGNLVAPSTSGNILTSNGTTWTSAANIITTTTGSAPYYGARAFVNFNGTGTPAIRASGNVSSITDNGTADYTVNFTTAMPDVNYSLTGGTRQESGGGSGPWGSWVSIKQLTTLSTSSVRIVINAIANSGWVGIGGNISGTDSPEVCVAFHR
jgi:hypothetical protein